MLSRYNTVNFLQYHKVHLSPACFFILIVLDMFSCEAVQYRYNAVSFLQYTEVHLFPDVIL